MLRGFRPREMRSLQHGGTGSKFYVPVGMASIEWVRRGACDLGEFIIAPYSSPRTA